MRVGESVKKKGDFGSTIRVSLQEGIEDEKMGKKGKKRGSLGLLGLDPTLGIGDKVVDHIEEAKREEKRRIEKSDFYASCPACGRRQVKKNLIENGCFICGWKGSEEEIELAQVKKKSKADIDIGIGSEVGKEKRGYKMRCPNCNALLITEQFEKDGCYLCGFREIKV